WWLILGRVGAEPVDSFTMLRNEVRSRVAPLIHGWDTDRVTPRNTALKYADAHLAQHREAEQAGQVQLAIP
ncbi:MAG: glutamate dehydrogenase, partial [Sciscionella sp.]